MREPHTNHDPLENGKQPPVHQHDPYTIGGNVDFVEPELRMLDDGHVAVNGEINSDGRSVRPADAERYVEFTPPPPIAEGPSNPLSSKSAQPVGNDDNENRCRAGCGFYGHAEQYHMCSKCFAKVRDDYFLVAVIAATVDRVDGVVSYVSAGGDISRLVSDGEVTKLASVGCFVKAQNTLMQIAESFQSDAALCYLLRQLDGASNAIPVAMLRVPLSSMLSHPSPARAAPTRPTDMELRDQADNDYANNAGEANPSSPTSMLVDNVRLEILSTIDRRPDGLVHFDTSRPDVPGSTTKCHVGKCFALPLFLVRNKNRDELLLHYTEQPAMIGDIQACMDSLQLIPQCSELTPLYTTADLNCALHATFLCMCGVRDGTLATDDPTASSVMTRTVLRDAVRESLQHCEQLCMTVSQGNAKRLEELRKDIEQGRASLDGGHIFALANVVRRPIVVYASAQLEGTFRSSLRVPFRISGVYLPLLWSPDATFPDPLMLCYSRGHFSAIVGSIDCQSYSTVSVPLCDELYYPLPVPFAPMSLEMRRDEATTSAEAAKPPSAVEPATDETPLPGHTPEEVALLKDYLRNVRSVVVGDGERDHWVSLCDQEHPPLPGVVLEQASAVGGVLVASRQEECTQWAQYLSSLWCAMAERCAAQSVGSNVATSNATAST